MDDIREKVPGGFIMPSEHLKGNVFVLTGQWDKSFSACFENGTAVGIRLSRSAGWQAEGLEFLSKLKMLKSVEIYNSDVKDISVLSTFQELEHLGLECPYKPFDFSTLLRLQVLMLNWRKGAESLFSMQSIRYLNVSGYPGCDLSFLAPLLNLSRLYIQSRKLVSVEGIEKLHSLTQLELAYCTSLDNIEGIAGDNQITHLMLYSCKKVTNIDALRNCQKLKCLHIECNSGVLDSVIPLGNCQNLEKLLLVGIRIKDGNLKPILSLVHLKKLALASYKNHSPSRDEIKAALGL